MPKLGSDKPPRIKRENKTMAEAFELYLSMGPDERSYRLVAKKIGKSEKAVQMWAQSFQWQDRLKEREEKQNKLTANRIDETAAQRRARHAKIAFEMTDKIYNELKDTSYLEAKPSDLARFVTLEREIHGDASSPAPIQIHADQAAIQIISMPEAERKALVEDICRALGR